MNHVNARVGRRIKAARMVAAACLGAVWASGCSVADLRANVMAGTLGFVKGYAESLLEALIPPADEILGTSEQ